MSDSPIWTNAAGDVDPFADLEIPDNIDEIAKIARETSKRELAPRLKRFRRGRKTQGES